MKTQTPKPNWFTLDLIFMIFLLALLAESQAAFSPLEHGLILTLMLIGFAVLIGGWTWANQYALESVTRREKHPYTITVHTVPQAVTDPETEEVPHDLAA